MHDPAERFLPGFLNSCVRRCRKWDSAMMHTLRCVMVIDNAGAPSHWKKPDAAPATTQAPRRRLSEQEIAEILQVEIGKEQAADQYARLGNGAQAAKLHNDIATIQHLTTLLN